VVAKLIAIEKEFALGAGRVGRGLEHDGNSFAEWSVNAKVYAARRLRLGADGEAALNGWAGFCLVFLGGCHAETALQAAK
jgi:hypothetical protein